MRYEPTVIFFGLIAVHIIGLVVGFWIGKRRGLFAAIRACNKEASKSFMEARSSFRTQAGKDLAFACGVAAENCSIAIGELLEAK